MNNIYLVVAAVAGIGLPLLAAAIALGRILGRLEGIQRLFEQAIEHWERMEGIQDAAIRDHEQRIRVLEQAS